MALIGFLGLGLASIVVVIVLIAGGYIFSVSQNASHQSSPTGAVDSFLDAELNERNPGAVEKYLCDKKTIKQQTNSLIDNLKNYQKQHPNNSIDYLWSSPRLKSKHEDHAVVTSSVTARTIVNGATSDAPSQVWTFSTVDESGWKICGMTIGS